MNSLIVINSILMQLRAANINVINHDSSRIIGEETVRLLTQPTVSPDDILEMEGIIRISNILYNNTDREILPIEDAVYDSLVIRYEQISGKKAPIGAEPIQFPTIDKLSLLEEKKTTDLITVMDPDKLVDSMYLEQFCMPTKRVREDCLFPLVTYLTPPEEISKRIKDTAHIYPELVGTLDKAKFVINAEAKLHGAFDLDNVKILERDFFAKHIKNGILDPNREFTMVLELKYDGISIEAEVSNRILSARSRGDTANEVASDYTPILEGFRFPRSTIPDEEKFGMKFEAIITTSNLMKLNEIRMAQGQEPYKNCRNAIIGIFGLSNAREYRDFITLVPLATSIHGLDRLEEIKFMNDYFFNGQPLKASISYGNLYMNLYMITRFLEEAEYFRNFADFMFDGIVVGYYDQDLRDALGRSNSINQYQMAVKFNPMKKQTIFTGYSYTVGQSGEITPMIHFSPIEFYGGIHNKCTGHSYKRFKELDLRIGDVLDIEYVNDVMCYATKPSNPHNNQNQNPVLEFPKVCPSCGSTIEISESGKMAMCPNRDCPERALARMVNMMKKLNLKDFSDESLRSIARYSLSDLVKLTREDVAFLGEVNSQKFMDRIDELFSKPIYVHVLVGSLGFSNIAIEKWKTILGSISLKELIIEYSMDQIGLLERLSSIKGIGTITAQTIIDEMELFMNDIILIASMPNVIHQYEVKKSIRFTGFRDQDIVNKLSADGYDISATAGLTNSTDILLIPYEGFTSSKTEKALRSGKTQIIPVQEFLSDLGRFL